MLKNKMSVLLLLVIAVMLVLSFVNPIGVYAEGDDDDDDDGKTATTDIFSDFDVSFGKDSKDLTIKSQADSGAWGTLITKYKGFITGIAAVGAVTMVVLFIMQFLKLGASAGNPQARSQALVGVLWTGIAAAGLGAVALITGIFYNAV